MAGVGGVGDGDEEAERRGALRWLARLGAGVLAGGWLWASLAAGGHGPRGSGRGRVRDTGLTLAELVRGGRPVVAGPVVLIPTKTSRRRPRGGTKRSPRSGRGSGGPPAGMRPSGARVGVRALDRRCSHLGCPVAPDPAGGDLACPCHGSRFDLRGRPTRGPATSPLRERRVTVDGEGRIWVHGRG